MHSGTKAHSRQHLRAGRGHGKTQMRFARKLKLTLNSAMPVRPMCAATASRMASTVASGETVIVKASRAEEPASTSTRSSSGWTSSAGGAMNDLRFRLKIPKPIVGYWWGLRWANGDDSGVGCCMAYMMTVA